MFQIIKTFPRASTKQLILPTSSLHLNEQDIFHYKRNHETETKNLKSQYTDGVSLNYRLVITPRHTMMLPSFLGNIIFIVSYHWSWYQYSLLCRESNRNLQGHLLKVYFLLFSKIIDSIETIQSCFKIKTIL